MLLTALALLFAIVTVLRLLPCRGLRARAQGPLTPRPRALTPAHRAEALEDAARAARALGARQRAAGYFLRALRVDPGRTSALEGLVEMYLASGALRRAERVLWRALEHSAPPLRDAAKKHLLRLYAGPLASSPRVTALRELARGPL